jgi:hypothetical protein
MAKRSRLSSRPGQRPPIKRTTARPDATPPPPADPVEMPLSSRSGLTSLEEARAEELESRLVAQEKAAAESARRAKERARGGRPEVSTEPLAVRAAAEYAYVRRDVRRITLIGALLLGIMALLHLAINVAGLITF